MGCCAAVMHLQGLPLCICLHLWLLNSKQYIRLSESVSLTCTSAMQRRLARRTSQLSSATDASPGGKPDEAQPLSPAADWPGAGVLMSPRKSRMSSQADRSVSNQPSPQLESAMGRSAVILPAAACVALHWFMHSSCAVWWVAPLMVTPLFLAQATGLNIGIGADWCC